MNKKLRRPLIVTATVLLWVALDQFTKILAMDSLRGNAPQFFLGDLFRLEYSENPGAFLSLGAGLPDSLRFWLLTVLVAGFLIGGIYYLFSDPKMTKLTTASLSFIIAGGLSNFLDRAFRENGRVVDFMNIGVGQLRTGIFNVADVAIMVGVGLVVLNLIQEQKKNPRRK